jgi:excisionase family DNA binding protein
MFFSQGKLQPPIENTGTDGVVCNLPPTTKTDKYLTMENLVLDEIKKQREELAAIKQLTLIGIKKAITMSDCALLTGLSKSHLYKLVMNKKIPYFKSPGNKITYFDKSEVEAWQLQHRVKTTDEIEAAAANYCVTGKHRKGA